MEGNQNIIRARFCHALSEMYKSEVPLYGDLVNIVWEADATVVRKSQEAGGNRQHNDIDPDEILPSRNRVERHGAIRLGTAYELATIKRMFAIMGMFPVGYYDLSMVGFPMHATAFRPQNKEALDENPFRVFTTLLRMDLLSEKTRDLVARVLEQRKIFTDRMLVLIGKTEKDGLSSEECSEFIAEGLETFRWHSKATVTLEEYQILQNEHPLIADIISFPSCHINHLTPRTINIDLVQKLMRDHGMPVKEWIEGPPQRKHPILLRQTSFRALEETVYFRDASGVYVKGSHAARFGEVEQRGYALTRKGRHLYDQILQQVSTEAAEKKATAAEYKEILDKYFQKFPDDLTQLHSEKLVYLFYSLGLAGNANVRKMATVKLDELLQLNILQYEPITYEDFLPLSAGGIFNSNLRRASNSKELTTTDVRPDLEGFQRDLGGFVTDEFRLYEQMQQASLERCGKLLGIKIEE